MRLTKNKVLITGATSGIGLEMTRRMLALDNEVLAVGRNRDKLATLAASYDNLSAYHCDLADPEALQALARQLAADHPDLNVLINNAGIQYNYQLGEEGVTEADISREIAVNLRATIFLTQALLPVLEAQTSAAVVNVSAGLAFALKRSAPVYCATQAGVHAFTQGLRYQLEASRVKVFEVIPPEMGTSVTEGRPHDKVAVAKLVSEFIRAFRRDQFEVNIGKVKLLRSLARLWPATRYRSMKNG